MYLLIIRHFIFCIWICSSQSLHSLFGLSDPFRRMSMFQTKTDYLHIDEYPNDDFNHILGYNIKDHALTKLQQISRDKINDVKQSKEPIDTQGCGIDRSFYFSSEDLENEMLVFDEKYGVPLDLRKCIINKSPMAIAAEFKRASPSKGDINVDIDCVQQCLEYARIGAAIISVLTEFKHFKGTLRDMKDVRLATQKELGSSRPAILRKDFIFDKYQLLEARVNGADTVLLIVACLGVNQLKDLINYSRKLKMEPLVEVHTQREMEIAITCNAKVIGVNNRNLHTFQLDLDTTQKALTVAREKGLTWQYTGDQLPDITIISLSGVTTSSDVNNFKKLGVSAVLVGETLMKAPDPREMIIELLSGKDSSQDSQQLIKICGFTQDEDVKFALQNSVNLIGMIFAKSPRTVTIEKAISLTQVIMKYGERSERISQFETDITTLKNDKLSSKLWYNRCADLLKKVTIRRPLSVGVFQNHPIEYVNNVIEQVGLDVVQLHGDETPEYAKALKAPCIKVIHARLADSAVGETDNVSDTMLKEIDSFSGIAIACLIDSRIPGSSGGGTGQVFDWSITQSLDRAFLLAGGLNAENVKEALQLSNVIGVDVSSQIEISPGIKNLNSLKQLTSNAREYTK